VRTRAVGGGVEKTEDGVGAGSGLGCAQLSVVRLQCLRPHFDVGTLQAAHLARLALREMGQVVLLHPYEFGPREGEVRVEVDQSTQRVTWRVGGCDVAETFLEKVATDVDQHFGKDRLFARKVLVNARAADTHGMTELVDSDAVESALGEEERGGVDDLATAIRRSFNA
jgi:hypothetical protein